MLGSITMGPVYPFDASSFRVNYNTEYGTKSIERKSLQNRGFFEGIPNFNVLTTAVHGARL